MFDGIMNAIRSEINVSQAMSHLLAIHLIDRASSYKDFDRSAEYCERILRQAGLDDIELLSMKADGRTAYGDWVVPQAWDPVAAELRITQPQSAARRIACYREEPRSLFMYSAPTPQGGVEAELAVLDEASQLDALSLRGKILLLSGKPGVMVGPAVRAGALGFVSDYQPELPHVRDRFDLPDAVRWENDCFVPRNVGGLFGFSISPRDGAYLRELVRQEGKHGRAVRLSASVDARLYDGVVKVVSGRIPGREPEEVLVDTHLYEPGANDNASGCGVSLELARCIVELIRRGELPTPRRSIRFLFDWECAGFMGYATLRRERIQHTIAALNMDTIGGYQDRNRSTLNLVRSPHANPSCTDLLLGEITRHYQERFDPLMRWKQSDCGTSASIYADPTIGLLASGLWQWPDMTWHTSADGPQRLDETALRRAGVIAGTFLSFMAHAGAEEAAWLATKQAAEATGRLEAMTAILMEDADPHRFGTGGDLLEAWRDFADKLDYAVGRELRILRSTMRLADPKSQPAVQRRMEELGSETEAAGRRVRQRAIALFGSLARQAGFDFDEHVEGTMGAQTHEASGLIPVRKVAGPLTLFPLLGDDAGRFPWDPYYSYGLNCPLYWADGKRTLREIAKLVKGERGQVDLNDLVAYFTFLAERGYLDLLQADGNPR